MRQMKDNTFNLYSFAPHSVEIDNHNISNIVFLCSYMILDSIDHVREDHQPFPSNLWSILIQEQWNDDSLGFCAKKGGYK